MILKIPDFNGVIMANKRHHAKFVNMGKTVAGIWPFFDLTRWRTSAILHFETLKFYHLVQLGRPICITVPNLMPIGRSLPMIWPFSFLIFRNGKIKISPANMRYYNNKNWLQFLLIVKAAVLKQQISKFYPQIQRTEASDHIYFSQRPFINVKAIFCA